jgi:hypothetical protein
MALQKPDGGIRPILCGEVWRFCFAILEVNTTPIRNEEHSYLLLPMMTLFKLQVFGMVPHIVRKYYQYSMITLIFRILMILM